MRRIVLLLVCVGLAVGACTDPGELGPPTLGGGTVAARIGDEAITNADLEDEVELWASAPGFLNAIDPTTLSSIGEPGRRSADLVAFVLSHRVISEQARAVAVLTDYTPSDQEIDTILAGLAQGFGDVFAELAEDFRQLLADDLAYQENLRQRGLELPHEPVEINPRYGVARDVGNGLVQVDPPAGPIGSDAPGTFAG